MQLVYGRCCDRNIKGAGPWQIFQYLLELPTMASNKVCYQDTCNPRSFCFFKKNILKLFLLGMLFFRVGILIKSFRHSIVGTIL